MTLVAGRTPALQLGGVPRVDLLPPSERQRRDLHARARGWVFVGLGAVLVALLAVGGTFAMSTVATGRLAAENARTLDIAAQTAGLAPVSSAVSTRGELRTLRQQAMAGDLTWSSLIALIAASLPAGVTITGYTLSAGPIPTGTDPAASAAGVGAIGSVTVTTAVPLDLVAATRALRAADHVRAVDVEDYAAKDGVITYRFHVEIDQSVYSGAYATKGQ